MLAYFEQHESKNSLWSVYSMLKLCLITNNNIDISKFPRLIAYLKRKTEHHKPKKSAVLDDHEVSKFIKEAPDFSYLMMKVALILGVSGALRREELCKMKLSDIEFRSDVVVVTIPETKTGTPRSFAITQPEWIKKLETYTKLRKPNNQRYFLTYCNGKCTNMPVGINTIGKIPMKIAQFLGLENPSTFTGHSFRRTSATMLANHGEGLIGIKQLGGWKSSTVAESYIQDSLHSKIQLSKRIQSRPDECPEPQCSTTSFVASVNVQNSQQTASNVTEVPGVEIKECSECTVNVHVYNSCTFSSSIFHYLMLNSVI